MLWAGIGLMTLAVLVIVAWPLVRHGSTGGGGADRDFDAAVYRDQLGEADRDVERGVLSAEEAEAAKAEISRRLLEAAGGVDGPAAGADSPGWRFAPAIILAILLPGAGIGLYAAIGEPGLPDQPFAQRQAARQDDAQARGQMIRAIQQLAARMEKDPDRLEGWLLLARSHMTLRDFRAAAEAYRRAFALSQGRADVAANFGEALFFLEGGTVTTEARQAFAAAIAADDREPKALYYQGVDELQQGNPKRALQAWVNLVSISRPDAPWLDMLLGRIRETAAEAGIDAKSIRPTLEAAAPAKGPSAGDVERAKGLSADERQEFIRAMVERLAGRLAGNPDDIEGWRMLARSYRSLGEEAKARDAEARVEALAGK